MSNTANHKPSERHTVDEVLKSLQDLIRNDALEDGKSKAPAPEPVDPSIPRKRGRPRKVVIQDAAAPASPARRSSANLTEELNSVLASLNDLVNTDLGDAKTRPPKPAESTHDTRPLPPSDDLQAAADALAALDNSGTETDTDTDTLSLEELAESAEEIVAAPPPPNEPVVEPSPAASTPAPAATPAPKQQLELKVIEPGEWKEPETKSETTPAVKPATTTEAPTAKQAKPALAVEPAGTDSPGARAKAPERKSETAPAAKPATTAQTPTAKKAKPALAVEPARTDTPGARASVATPATSPVIPKAPGAPAKPSTSPTAATPAPVVARSPGDEETIELSDADAITELVVNDDTVTVGPEADKPSPAKTPAAAKPPTEHELDLELTLEDPTRRNEPAPVVIDHEREKELNNLGLAEIDFSQVPEASSEHFAAFASSIFSADKDHALDLKPVAAPHSADPAPPADKPSPPPGRTADLSLDDSIPLLEDEVSLPPSAPRLDSRQTRDLAVRAIARLNIELRKAGQQGLDVKTIQRLQALLREELEKAGKPGENTRPKK